MLNAIIRFSIRNKLIVGLLMLALVGVGILELRKLPIDALPDITSNQVQIITVSPALAAPEVERLVTFSVEQFCSNIQGITEMRSISRFGLSVVTIVFSDQTDIYWARQQVAERLTYIKDEIPVGTGNPSLAPLTTGLGEVYQYILKPAAGYEGRYNLADLRTIQDWIVRRQLMGTKGVADVSSFGGHLKQYEIAFRAEKLNAMGLTVADVYSALQQNNQNSGGAYIEKHDQVLFIRTEGLVKNLPEIEQIVLKHSNNGTPIFMRDVATVKLGKAIRYGALVDGGKGEAAGGVVLMLKGANGMQVVNDVKARIEQIKTTLPEGVLLEPFYDRSKMVTQAISTVRTNLTEGALIVVFILVLFLGNFRAGLIVASVIPLAMLFAVIMMNLFGVSGNLMSLGALDFGLIVDGAVIIVEAVLHRLHHKTPAAAGRQLSQTDIDHEVEQAAGKMMNAAVFGQVIILIVYLPILALVGIEGKMFKPMAQTVTFALIGAFLLSLTYVPMMTSLAIGKRVIAKTNFSDRLMAAIEKAYLPVLHLSLNFKRTLIAAVLIAFILALVLMGRLGGEFIPELEEGDFAVDTRLLTGSSLTASVDASQDAARILESRFPEIEKIVCRVGASEIPTDPMPVEMGDLIILLKDKKQWTSAKTYDELADKMSAALAEVPGLSAGFQFPVQMRFNELISGARQDVVVKVFGEDLDTLAAYANSIGTLTQRVNGATDHYVETVTGLPQIVVSYRRDALAVYGVSIDAVNQIIRTAFAGESAGTVYENERRFQLVLRLDKDYRTDIDDVQNLMVNTASGQQIPLHLLADVSIKEGPNQIQRENTHRRIIVAFNVRNRDVESVVGELQQLIGKQIKLPPGYYIHYGGAFENLSTAKERLMIAVPVALLLILLLLYFAFNSLKHCLLIFSAIPLSAIGGVFALWLRDMPFSISAGVGFIALFGVAVLNGIVLITEFNRLKKEGELTMDDIIINGTRSRLRPVLMTAAVASLGFLPMALSQSAGAEVQRPLASVVIGGLITATFLTLVVLPVLYKWVERVPPGQPLRNRLLPMLLVAALLTTPALAQVQPALSLEAALQRLPQANRTLKAGELHRQYLASLQRTAAELPYFRANAELGQTNSRNFDSRLSIAQGFLPFGFVKSQRSVLQSQYISFDSELQLRKLELRLLVRQIFLGYEYESNRQQYFQSVDTLYQRLENLAAQRLKAGETNRLELAGFQQQRQVLQQAMAASKINQQQWQMQLKILLQTDTSFVPAGAWQANAQLPAILDTSLLSQHAAVRLREAMLAGASAETVLESARRQPALEVGYNNQSLVGFQTDRAGNDKWYSAGNRFSTGHIGVLFPLFGKATKARVTAAKEKEKQMAYEASAEKQQVSMAWRGKFEQTMLQWQQMKRYETELLPTSNTIIETARQQLQRGELSYVNWLLIAEPAFQTRLAYIDEQLSYQLLLAQTLYYSEQ